jgi:hypothetical protein
VMVSWHRNRIRESRSDARAAARRDAEGLHGTVEG